MIALADWALREHDRYTLQFAPAPRPLCGTRVQQMQPLDLLADDPVPKDASRVHSDVLGGVQRVSGGLSGVPRRCN